LKNRKLKIKWIADPPENQNLHGFKVGWSLSSSLGKEIADHQRRHEQKVKLQADFLNDPKRCTKWAAQEVIKWARQHFESNAIIAMPSYSEHWQTRDDVILQMLLDGIIYFKDFLPRDKHFIKVIKQQEEVDRKSKYGSLVQEQIDGSLENKDVEDR
jgi:hypothetical protein